MWIVGLLLLAVSGGLFYGHRSKQKRLGHIVSTEICTVEHLREVAKSMAEGFGSGALRFPAALRAKVRCAEPLVSELAETPCVYYSMWVNREYEEKRTTEDSRGRRETKSHRSSDRLAANERSVPFRLEDATGSIRVDPAGAKWTTEKSLSRFEPAVVGPQKLAVGSYSLNVPAPPAGSRTLGYRFEEQVIPVDRDVFVLGEVRDPSGELRIGGFEGEGDFLVSVKNRSQLIKDLGSGSKGMKIAAMVFAAAGILLVIL